jgi:hypothetical protein
MREVKVSKKGEGRYSYHLILKYNERISLPLNLCEQIIEDLQQWQEEMAKLQQAAWYQC